MKKGTLTILFVFFCITCIGQNYLIESDGVEDVITNYAKEIIDKNINVRSGYEYKFTLKQNGDALTISYAVNPNNIIGEESTDDLWNEIEQLIKRTLDAVDIRIDNVLLAQKEAERQKELELAKKNETVEIKPDNAAKAEKTSVEKIDDKSEDNFFKKQYEQVKSNIEERQDDKQTDRINQQNFYNGMKVYSIEEVRNGIATIGSLMQFADGSKGVIYFLDDQGHGLAVSLEQTRLKWEDVDDEEDCRDLPALVNMSRFDRQCVIGLGAEETSEIVAYQGYPAANWCVSRGNGWYLPSIGELYQLLVVANAEKGKNGFISVILTTCGGTPLDGNWYWSSTEENAENIYNISAYGRIATEIKCEKVYVRAVRQF